MIRKSVLPWSCEGRTYFCCLVMTCYDELLTTVIIAVKGTHGKSFVIIWWWGVRAIFSVFSYYLLHSSVALTCKISFKKPFVRKKSFHAKKLFISIMKPGAFYNQHWPTLLSSVLPKCFSLFLESSRTCFSEIPHRFLPEFRGACLDWAEASYSRPTQYTRVQLVAVKKV